MKKKKKQTNIILKNKIEKQTYKNGTLLNAKKLISTKSKKNLKKKKTKNVSS